MLRCCRADRRDQRLASMQSKTYVLHNMVSRHERVAELLRRLEAAGVCGSAEQALELVVITLNDVEDALSGVAFNPDYPLDDGRMYPPREDARRAVEGRPELRRYRSRRHNIYVSDDGALRIEEVRGRTCLLDKPGRNGRKITL